MIEAKDLRIGNNFQNDEGNILTCFGVAPVDDSDQFNIWYGNELGFILLEEEAKPIPLTEEWLIKFGFEKSNADGKYYNGKVPPIYWVYKTQYGMNGLPLNTSFSYVHSLQNLYFSLCGESLTIKE
jgi:hypothetical protein